MIKERVGISPPMERTYIYRINYCIRKNDILKFKTSIKTFLLKEHFD